MFAQGLQRIGASVFGGSLNLGHSLQLRQETDGVGTVLSSSHAAANTAAPTMSLDQSFTEGLLQVLASVQLSAVPGPVPQAQAAHQPLAGRQVMVESTGIFGDLSSPPLIPLPAPQQGRAGAGLLTSAAAAVGHGGRDASTSAAAGEGPGVSSSGFGLGDTIQSTGSAPDELASSFFAALPRSRPASSSTQTQSHPAPGPPSRARTAPSLLVDDDDLAPEADHHHHDDDDARSVGGTRGRLRANLLTGPSTPASVGVSDGGLSLRPHSGTAPSLSPMPLLGWPVRAARGRSGTATNPGPSGAATQSTSHHDMSSSYSVPPSPGDGLGDELAEAMAAADIGSFAPEPDLCIKPSPRAFAAAAAAGVSGGQHPSRPWPVCQPSRPARTLLREPSRAAYAHSLEVEHSRLMPGVHTVASFPLAPPAATDSSAGAGGSGATGRTAPAPLSKALLRYDGLLVVGTQARPVSIEPLRQPVAGAGSRPGAADAHHNHICVAWLSEPAKLPWGTSDTSATGPGGAAGTGTGKSGRRPLAAPPSVSAPWCANWIPVRPLADVLAARGCAVKPQSTHAAAHRPGTEAGMLMLAKLLASLPGGAPQPVSEYVRDMAWLDESGSTALLAMGRYLALLTLLPAATGALATAPAAGAAGMSVDNASSSSAADTPKAEFLPLLLHPPATSATLIGSAAAISQALDLEAALPFASEIRCVAVAPASAPASGSRGRVPNRLFAACDFAGTVIVASAESVAPGSALNLPLRMAVHCRFTLPGAASVSFHPSRPGMLAVTSDTGAVSLLDIASRRVLQRARLPLPALFSGAVAANGTLLVGTGTGHIVACEAPATGLLAPAAASGASATAAVIGPCSPVGAGAFADAVVAEIGDITIAHRCPVPPTRACAPPGARAALAGRPPAGAARSTDHSCMLLSGAGGWSLYEADLLDPTAPPPSFHMRACGFVNRPPAAPAFPPMALPGAPVLVALQSTELQQEQSAAAEAVVVNGKRLRGAAAAAAAASRGAAANASTAVVDVTGLASANEYFVTASCSATFVLHRPPQTGVAATLQRPPPPRRHGMTHADVTRAVAAAAAAASGVSASVAEAASGPGGPEAGRYVVVTSSYGHLQVFDTWSGLGAKTPSVRELRPLPAIARELNDPAVRVRAPKATPMAPAVNVAAQAAEAAAALSMLACSPAPPVASYGHAALISVQFKPPPAPSSQPQLAARASDQRETAIAGAPATNPVAQATRAGVAMDQAAPSTHQLASSATRAVAPGSMVRGTYMAPSAPVTAPQAATSGTARRVTSTHLASQHDAAERSRVPAVQPARSLAAGGNAAVGLPEPVDSDLVKHAANRAMRHNTPISGSAAAGLTAAVVHVEPRAVRQPPLLGKSAGLPVASRPALPPLAAAQTVASGGAAVNGLAARLLASNAVLHALAAAQTTARLQASLIAEMQVAASAPSASSTASVPVQFATASQATVISASGDSASGGPFAPAGMATTSAAASATASTAPVIVHMPSMPSMEQQRADFLAALAASSATVAAASAAALHAGGPHAFSGSGSRAAAGMRTDGSDDDDDL